ncbi:hypothetical protein AM587_10006524 [Phytophthora nicotianae]|uniref:Ubiquitin-like protease family profile domain-containing protein n=1 Tax=Phytophthora nicotianae TaxID=4792 RepID=A0A0W8BX53_PHYNI|nr:hypothetical protein AM587_10006524 [Phytophthora nicotianae]
MATSVPAVRLTGKVRQVGRPKLNRAEVREKTRVALKEDNAGMNLRVILRESDVCDVVATLREIKPAVRTVGSYLGTHQVKTVDQNRAMKWSVDEEYVASRVRFRLPESVIDDVLNLLKNGIGRNEEIELGSDGEWTGDITCFVVTIEKLGQFTREQLEAMKWLWNLQAACRNAVLSCTWLSSVVKPVAEQPVAPQVTNLQILECRPYAELNGFGFDLTYSDLFCLRDSVWLNDNTMSAVTVSLGRYKKSLSVMLPPPTENPSEELQSSTIDEISQATTKRPFVLLPINLGGVHWAGIIVNRAEKKVMIYDSLNGAKDRKELRTVADFITTKALKDESNLKVDVTEPTQMDSSNCGVFVSLFFWSAMSDEAPSDLSPTGLTKLQWSLLNAILKMKQR